MVCEKQKAKSQADSNKHANAPAEVFLSDFRESANLESSNSKIVGEKCGLPKVHNKKSQGSLLNINDRSDFSPLPHLSLQAELQKETMRETQKLHAPLIINCTYAGINHLLQNSHLPPLPLKFEMTEMALVNVPKSLQNISVTIMDGAFFSLMPYPSKNCYTLSHVRYTPHFAWRDFPLDLSSKLITHKILITHSHKPQTPTRCFKLLNKTQRAISL